LSTNSEDNTEEQGGTSNGTKKRKRWGVMPPGDGSGGGDGNSAAGLGATDTVDAAAQARAKALATLAKVIATPAQAASSLLLVGNTVVAKPPPKVPPATKRVWVDAASHSMLTEERPAAHFVAYTNRYIPELINKLNSTLPKPDPTTATTTTNGDGKKDDEDDDGLTIEFKGKGASDKPPLLGMPEEPLHVFIRGPKLLVEQAEYEIEELLERAKTAPIEEDAINARLAAEGALTTTGGSSMTAQPIPTTTHYRPASVAQLIGQANMPYEQRMQQDNAPLLEETIGVPNGIVGYIIGRGGENIASMQAKTGAKVQIQKEHELQPGQTERQITLQAHSLEAIKACRTIIENMVQERIRALTGGSNNNNPAKAGIGYSNANMKNDQHQDSVQAELALGHKLVEVDVPDADVGLVIGKGGGTCCYGLQDFLF
jgi:transcription antitermination factor NusA-like protein